MRGIKKEKETKKGRTRKVIYNDIEKRGRKKREERREEREGIRGPKEW